MLWPIILYLWGSWSMDEVSGKHVGKLTREEKWKIEKEEMKRWLEEKIESGEIKDDISYVDKWNDERNRRRRARGKRGQWIRLPRQIAKEKLENNDFSTEWDLEREVEW